VTTSPYLYTLSLHDALPIYQWLRCCDKRTGFPNEKAAADGPLRTDAGQRRRRLARHGRERRDPRRRVGGAVPEQVGRRAAEAERSEEHTSELQSRENLVCRL